MKLHPCLEKVFTSTLFPIDQDQSIFNNSPLSPKSLHPMENILPGLNYIVYEQELVSRRQKPLTHLLPAMTLDFLPNVDERFREIVSQNRGPWQSAGRNPGYLRNARNCLRGFS